MEPGGSPGLRGGSSQRLSWSAVLVDLDAVCDALADEDPVLFVDGDTDWALERCLPLLDRGSVVLAQLRHLGIDGDLGCAPLAELPVAGQRLEVAAIGRVDLNDIVGVVRGEDVAKAVNTYAGRSLEAGLAVSIAVAGLVATVGVELLDSAILPINDVDIPRHAANRDAPGAVELAGAAAELAPLRDVLAILGELLNPIVEAVDDQDVAVAIDGQPGRAIELTRAGALCSPLAQEVAVQVKD